MNSKIIIRVCLCILILAILFIGIYFTLFPFNECRVFNRYGASVMVEIHHTQLMIFLPFASSSGGVQGGQDFFLMLEQINLPFPLTNDGYTIFPSTPTNPYLTFEINFRRGTPTLVNRYNNLGIGEQWTFTQNVFWNAPKTNYWSEIEEDTRYIVWLGFDQPMTDYQVIQAFPTLFVFCSEDAIGFGEFGVSWFAMKTSDDPNAIVLGTGGDLHSRMLGVPDGHVLGHRFFEFQTHFADSLQFLVDHKVASDLIISSGLWDNAETVDFAERLEFVQQNGFYYLGFVAYIRGSDLLNLQDTGVNIVRLIEDR